MKKLISLCLCAIMMLTMLPVNVYAIENDSSERDELIALACKVFPEYANAIRRGLSRNSNNPRTVNTDWVVFEETRKISDDHSLTLSQFASGNVIIISQLLDDFPIDVTDSNISDLSNVGVYGTASFEMASSTIGWFKLNDVAFTIYYHASDYFTNYGSADYSHVDFGEITKTTTFIEYNLVFNPAGQPLYAPFQLYFSNNQLVARTY